MKKTVLKSVVLEYDCTGINDGGFFVPYDKPCMRCYCNDGKAKCQDISHECDFDIKCRPSEDVIIPFGQCCPICRMMAAATGEFHISHVWWLSNVIPLITTNRNFVCTETNTAFV